MKKILVAITLCMALSNLNAQQFKLDTLLFNGNSDKRINYVILGDGYLITQRAKYLQDAENVIVSLFSNTPFKEYKNYFNIFAISVPSNVEGAALDPSNPIDNYFGSTFNFGGIQRLLVPTKVDKVAEVLATTFPTYDQVMMIVNSTEYGGSGGWISTSSVNILALEIATHELGHSFGGLSDEYWAGEQYAFETPNMTQQSSTSLVRWKSWLNNFGIGIIPHAGSSNWFKPHNNCKMQFLGKEFCSVCKEQFIRTIHGLTSCVDQFTSDIGLEVIKFSLDLVKPDPNTLKIKWLLNELKYDQNTQITNVKLLDLSSGTNTVEAIIYDSTTLDRRNTVYMTSIKWTIQNSISSSVQEILGDRPEETITDVKSEISQIRLSVFPNPSGNKLTVVYDLTRRSPIELSILNSEGKRILNIVEETQIQGNHTYEIDISSYSNGLYILNFKSGTFYQYLRIIKRN